MRFSSDDIWHDIPEVDISDEELIDFIDDGSIFRVCLEDFIYAWKGFPSMHPSKKRERLSSIFNVDYFEEYTVLTDVVSLKKLLNTDFYEPSPANGSGFIYIYTFEDNVLAGLYEPGLLWWRTKRYEAKLKIGRTEQNVLRRIDQQLDRKTGICEPPILLAVFWTQWVVSCEHEIHQELAGKRLSDKTGKPAKGGVEWFKATPTLTLPVVLKWVEHFSRLSPPVAVDPLIQSAV
ncbi:GIY-YIG nuclease family protein [Nodosilinea sp. FACHB-131]|uniref:GIY-YIG nuclease family protein n=1 Tax=Cyanophyceae TaxID=3028117 RepID=UPI0016870FC5|nr:GIY-YIG nuclease family protein [Nodosilinea sp. FACHB-131]MBD1873919.1 GIY-YIG nuclease family protein [Nodosilinea sp. FACHB-131]